MATKDIIRCDRSSVYWSGEKRYIDIDNPVVGDNKSNPLEEAKKCARLLSLKKALRLVEESKRSKILRMEAYKACSAKTFDLETEYGRYIKMAHDKAIRIAGLYTIEEYAILSKCSDSYMYKSVKEGQVPAFEIHHRCWVILDDQIISEDEIGKLKSLLSEYSLLNTYAKNRGISMKGLITKKFVQANKFLIIGSKLLVKSR